MKCASPTANINVITDVTENTLELSPGFRSTVGIWLGVQAAVAFAVLELEARISSKRSL